MNILLLFFALPIAVIIISIALQKILKCPILVSAIIFAIFLVVAFIVSNTTIFLIAAIVYAILSFITAVLTKLIIRIIRELSRRDERGGCCCSNDYNDIAVTNGNGNLLTISSSGCNGTENELLTISTNCSRNSNNNENNEEKCSCNCNNSIAVNANVVPNTNGQSGNFYGCYRRRR